VPLVNPVSTASVPFPSYTITPSSAFPGMPSSLLTIRTPAKSVSRGLSHISFTCPSHSSASKSLISDGGIV